MSSRSDKHNHYAKSKMEYHSGKQTMFIHRLILVFCIMCSVLPTCGNMRYSSKCFNTNNFASVKLTCDNGTVIHVVEVLGGKHTENSCTVMTDMCNEVIGPNLIHYTVCNGRTQCEHEVFAQMFRIFLKCDVTAVQVKYECVDESVSLDVCSDTFLEKNVSNSVIYLKSPGFPSSVAINKECKCNVKIPGNYMKLSVLDLMFVSNNSTNSPTFIMKNTNMIVWDSGHQKNKFCPFCNRFREQNNEIIQTQNYLEVIYNNKNHSQQNVWIEITGRPHKMITVKCNAGIPEHSTTTQISTTLATSPLPETMSPQKEDVTGSTTTQISTTQATPSLPETMLPPCPYDSRRFKWHWCSKSTNNFLRDYGYPEENLGIDRRFYKEGDIKLTLRRNAVRDIYATWLNRTVPYVISAAYDKDQRKEMLGAMHEFEIHTCIRFRPRTREPDYITIKPDGSCSSAVGRQGGEQTVSIGAGCNRKGTIMHELMHALGFWHEHSRPDRGLYITIVWDNIPENHESNFKSYSTAEIDTLGAPYDYGSITHYKNNTFAIDRSKPTITAKHPLPPGVEMGQRLKLSDIDILKINRLYRCNITHCPDAGAPMGGYRKGDNFSVSKTVSYYCHSDYTLVGSYQRYCMDIGQWTGNLPVCFLSDKNGKLKYCSFDRGRICDGWKQDTTDDTQWKVTNRGTPSEATGPKDDRTMGTQEGYYIFLESSTPCKEGMKARLISPTFSFPETRACLLFYYNMLGKTMGTLNVYQRIGGKNVLKYTRSGNCGADWKLAVIALEQYSQFEILFEGVAGSSFTSDVALDDIVVGSCDSLVPHIKNLLPVNMSCDFNNGMCGFIQSHDDVFDWRLKSGPTSTILTGPECDLSNCSSGKYLYTEASSPRVQGDTAKIVSPLLMGGSSRCMSFLFHMYGITMGTLKVYIEEYNADKRLVWTRSGDHGNKWQKEYIDFNPKAMYKIIFEGLRGSSYRSDIAIDNFDIRPGTCADVLYFDCDFEQDMCGWKNVRMPSDSFDWTRQRGPTWTGGTGPSTDHTNRTGYYIYIETSLQPSGTFARLISPRITDGSTGYCIQFWYHMYGLDVKSLKVIRQSVEKREEKELWEAKGQHGNWWRRQRLFVGSTGQDFRIIIEATAGGHRGDIAIDDVSIQNGSCYSYDAKSMHNFPFVQLRRQ